MKWTKIIILCYVIFITSCYKEDILLEPKPIVDIFTKSEIPISGNEEIMFNLLSDNIYILKLIDYNTGQVISKEKIIGKIGENKIILYTKSIQIKYLYLVLEDVNKKQKGKTKLILK
jgi:hypothetical protein